MAEVEKILNDQPLWSPSSDPMDDGPLTPNHLLLVQPNSSLPLGLFSKDDNYCRRWWKQANYLIEIFWKRWMKQYLKKDVDKRFGEFSTGSQRREEESGGKRNIRRYKRRR